MSILDDLFSLVDPNLANAYSNDPTKNRTTFINGLAKVKEQFENGKQPRGEKAMWSASNSVVAFTPKLNALPISLKGNETLYIPSERFPEFLKKLTDAASKGELDDHLKGDGEVIRTVRKSDGESKPRAPWSPERRARQEATLAARKAAKDKAAAKK
jgi:hypothetical protein